MRITRRRLLHGAAIAAGATFLGRSATSNADEGAGGGIVDSHSHIWTRDVERYPLAAGLGVDDLDPPSFTAKELVDLSAPLGVDRVVLIAHSNYYEWDNRYLTDTAERFPKRFRVVGMVDDRSENPDRRMRGLLKKHVTGFRILPKFHGPKKWLDGPGMASMWRTGAETRQAMCCLINPEDLPGVDRMCARFPETPVVIDHFARIGVDGEFREADVRALCALARHRHVSVKVSAFYALGRKRPPYDDLVPLVRRVHKAFGSKRLMWGSDAPYQIVSPNSYAASLEFVREGLDFLSNDDRDHLLRRTAASVFGFDRG